MARGGSIRDLDELIEDNRGGRLFRETAGEGGNSGGSGNNGSSHSKIGRREPRSRGEGRRRDRKSKDSVGPLTTPTPDNLPKAFYQAPVILERRIQKTEATSSKQVTKALEEITSHTTVAHSNNNHIRRNSLINNGLLENILSDLPGHFVVGVCGPQGVGKSTIISSLCEDPQNAFPSQSIDSLNFASHETNGIDIHVTPERIILLDAQSLQLLVFLYSVCNVLIVVTENIDYTMWNYLKKAEMLKYRIPEFPSIPSLPSADIGAEYYPDIGRCLKRTLSLSKTLTMYKSLEDRSSPNLFLLPYENKIFGRLNYLSAPETFSVLTESLKNQIFELPKRNGKKGQVSEREWFRSAFKVWDIVRKSDFLTDYGKLAQKLREM
ncbi:21078_t:CDS:10 [Entrophospora sp. SA101]|nr:22441_t:CDS:10 [Entrophospora sp. SA101]CAJ0918010.1 21078_t:CDS:10 [Entrophospora sp. SA101]